MYLWVTSSRIVVAVLSGSVCIGSPTLFVGSMQIEISRVDTQLIKYNTDTMLL